MTSKVIERAEILVTADNLWFLERYLNVFDFCGMFPDDAIGSEGKRGNPIKLHTDLGFTVDSDIDGSKMQLRARSKHRGWMRWTETHGLKVGDRVIIERIGERDYSLRLERGDGSSS